MPERLVDDVRIAELVGELRLVEETLRDLAYDRLRESVERGDDRSSTAQRRLEQARRGVAKAIQALESTD